jgi:stage II sporulation protein D
VNEPKLRVGLIVESDTAEFVLDDPYEVVLDGRPGGAAGAGEILRAQPCGELLEVVNGRGERLAFGKTVGFRCRGPADGTFLLKGMTVGVRFHWQHQEDLRFAGDLSLERRAHGLDVINAVPLESYLRSVVSSEMSVRCPDELLRAHAVISRSWLLAQLEGRTVGGGWPSASPEERDGVLEVRRWYDREEHEHFHVCADDHCQRYQGVTRMVSTGAAVGAAAAAVEASRGLVLMHGDRVCDARFSKCCGGMTERFSAAWGDFDLPYLQAFPDCPPGEEPFRLPLTDEANAEAFLRSSPRVWCNRAERALLERILPELDHRTEHFFRWDVSLTRAAVRELVREKLGLDPGPVQAIRPLERGCSGRIVCLEVVGRDRCLHMGKELEIRRLLSPTHLYSSAFTVRREGETFHLHGGGWGHGVGLCQIGAAVMADHGCDYREILGHYYRGADLRRLYA